MNISVCWVQLINFLFYAICPAFCNTLLHAFPPLCRVLDTLDLACNYFSKEAHLEPATRLPRIATIKLYGNPILGETGEDPIYIYIEGKALAVSSHQLMVECLYHASLMVHAVARPVLPRLPC